MSIFTNTIPGTTLLDSHLNYLCNFLLTRAHTRTATAKTVNTYIPLLNNNEPEGELADLLMSKGYLPSENILPKSSIIKNTRDYENDETYLLSKLSDDDLIKLLSQQSKKNEFNLNDLTQVAGGKGNDNAQFRLEHKDVEPQKQQNKADYIAWKKLNNLLNTLPQQDLYKQEKGPDDEKKELLFDILVAQLKSLCCKKKSNRQDQLLSHKLLQKILSKQYNVNNLKQNSYSPHFKALNPRQSNPKSGEFMFLIINDEIKTKGSNEIIAVDPESLEKNSSVLLLGPIKTPLSDEQLKVTMNRISNELSKPEYSSLLQQLSDGNLSENNKELIDIFVFGPQTRRYIKPHRCNHQSVLSKIYGGPKWLICTGYLNINTPSLYD